MKGRYNDQIIIIIIMIIIIIICHFEPLKNNNRILILVLIERVIFFIHRALIEAKNTLASNKEKVGFKTDCTATKRTVGRENKAGIQQYKNGCHACMHAVTCKQS